MKVIVVGAGLSGLVVAAHLQTIGVDVVVLEARNRVGGRVLTVREGLAHGQFAELGAETMYAGHDTVLSLAKRLDLDAVSCGYFDPAAPEMLINGRRLGREEREWITGWLRSQYRANPPALFENLGSWVARLAAPRAVVSFLRAFVQYTPVTSLRDADARDFERQLVHASDSFRIVGDNDLLPRRLAEGLEVRLGTRARVIRWGGRGPRVTVETDATAYHANIAVVTVPGPLVTELGFEPPLPASKTRALLELHYGTATKVVVQYAERQAVHKAVGTGCFTDGIPPWLVDQSVHQQGDAAVVSTLLGGRDEPCQVTEGTLARFDEALTALADQPVTRIYAAAHSWTRDEFSRAIVRAPLGDQRTRVLPDVQAPLGDVVFFAGEHTDDREGPGGLEGAVRSALRVLSEVSAVETSR